MNSRISDIETAAVGIVVAYDPTTRTADVQLATRRPTPTEDGEIVNTDRNVLPSVPVMFPGSGSVNVTWPIDVGTTGLVVTLRYSAQTWRASDGSLPTDPVDVRAHHESNSVFFPGWKPDAAIVLGATQNAYVIDAPMVHLGAAVPTAFASNDTLLQAELGKVAAAIAAIAAVLNTAGPVTGAPGTIAPYVPAATAFTRVKGV